MNKKNILVIDDEKDIRDSISGILNDENYGKPDEFDDEENDEIEENIPFYNKRMAKAMTKYGSTPEAPKISLEGFDVDLVMKKAACFNQTERIVSAKAYLRAKPVTPFHKMHNLTVNT